MVLLLLIKVNLRRETKRFILDFLTMWNNLTLKLRKW